MIYLGKHVFHTTDKRMRSHEVSEGAIISAEPSPEMNE